MNANRSAAPLRLRGAWLMPVAAAASVVLIIAAAWLAFRASQPTVPRPTSSVPVPSTAPPIRTPVVIALTLSPGLTRDNQTQTRVTIPAAADILRLQLELPRTASYSRYRAVLETAEGTEVWRGEAGLPQPGSSTVTVDVPAGMVIAADYQLTLSELTTDRPRNIADYSFRVRRQ